MKPCAIAVLLSCCLGLSACEDTRPDTYPISGAPCSPDDPVQTLDAGDCTLPN